MNLRINITKCFMYQHKLLVYYLIDDVITIFKALAC
jgi:hypothetical protein